MGDPRSWAATALGRIGPGTPRAEQAAALLTETLQSDTTPAVQIAAIEALARFGPLAHGAIPQLRELERGPNKRG